VTVDPFRKIATRLPEAVESAHMGHPDFRVRGKVFASLGYPDAAWGKGGATCVQLKAAKARPLAAVLAAAWRNTAPKTLVRRYDEENA